MTRLTLCAALAAGSLGAAGAMAQQVRPEYPKFSIPNPSPAIPGNYGPKGAEALNILKPYMPSVAAWYGLSEEDITASFLRKRDGVADRGEWRLDNDGRIVISERFLPVSIPGSFDDSAPPLNPLYRLETTFRLHSNDTAKIRIWVSLKGRQTYLSPNSPPELIATPDEMTALQHIWQRLAEDFAPFEVDVTTEKPTDADLIRSGPNDDRYGYQVIIDRSAPPGVSDPAYLEGLVYLNSFDDLDIRRRTITLTWPLPGSVPGQSSGPSPTTRTVAHMAAHMLGHALGLRDEDQRNGYGGIYGGTQTYAGHRTWKGSWAPIMGHPGTADMTQFSQGEFRGAISQTDSIARIARIIPMRADDVGDTPQTALKLALSRSSGQAQMIQMTGGATGIIGRKGDKDVYAIELSNKFVQAAIIPPLWLNGPRLTSLNFAADLSLVDASGNVLNNNSFYGPWIAYRVPKPGTYYLVVSGVGVGNPQDDGFSDYGSLGPYALSVTNEGLAPEADLKISATSGVAPFTVTFDASGSRDDGQAQKVNWNFGDGSSINLGPLRLNHTYTRPGTYAVSIQVVDDEGMTSASLSRILKVWAPNELAVDVDLKLISTSSTSSAAYGTLYVVDGNGKRFANASVNYSWGGLHQGQRSLVSRTQGSPVMSLPSDQNGCFQLTVTSITLAGYTYDARSSVLHQICR